MAYTIDRYSGVTLTTVEDGTVDQTTDIKLVGKNYAGYGEIQNENFLHLLENFSGTSQPPKAISGQICWSYCHPNVANQNMHKIEINIITYDLNLKL